MYLRKTLLQGSALALSLLAANVMAAVSTEEAAKLGTSLTPLGGEKAGNADGSIPAWTGGLAKDAAPVDAKGFLGDPFASEKPLFVITAQNVEQYKDKLSEGELAMFKRYPDTYKMPVYVTHRTTAVSDVAAQAAKTSALKTSLASDGYSVDNFASHAYPFPLPTKGVEVIWNHMARYRGESTLRVNVQTAVQANGSFTPVVIDETVAYPAALPELGARADNLLLMVKQSVTAPARLAGTVVLAHDFINPGKDPRKAWVYNAGQRRVRAAPQIAYDGPGTAADGLRTADNTDMFNGSPDRYDWKLVGKKELYIPYNNYRLASPSLKYDQIIKPGHINPDFTRYELHRVWEVEATLKSGERNIYAKRRFFIDEDSWQIAVSELYDGRGQLWRVGQNMLMQQYQVQVPWTAMESLNDLIAGRYLTSMMANEQNRPSQFGVKVALADFTPAALRNAGVR
ncbi:DUF1329 domain-containing protein [Pseudomonas sp. UL073]|uniref:DUF1329 domain-containing protein n=1 Tax=Zestomonas insulae TaxID=2809017 RepID=A0ABS2ICR1_9GAMM|nr:DUF1329 domain-containing protein [Pseudomonas insulae]MBM7060089.1 DUF1329 domain-containing protein [Pseudomonas insulae]